MSAPRWTSVHSRALTAQPVIGLNFHRLSPTNRPLAERQIRAAAGVGVPYDPGDAPPAPGVPRVLVAFYDGFAETGRWGADLCHRLGLRAYFFPVFAPPHGRTPLSDADLAEIGLVHEIGFHTAGHAAAVEVHPGNLEAEVEAPYARIRQITGRAPRIAAWKGGSRFDETLLGNRRLRELGITHLVSNWSVEAVRPSVPEDQSA